VLAKAAWPIISRTASIDAPGREATSRPQFAGAARKLIQIAGRKLIHPAV
jgi:hypothetical protein